jgi:hypothetical protein
VINAPSVEKYGGDQVETAALKNKKKLIQKSSNNINGNKSV